MTKQFDFFDDSRAARACGMDVLRYPDRAGHKGGDTSEQAADEIEDSGKADLIRSRVLEYMDQCPEGATADECAAAIGIPWPNVRPRFSELTSRGLMRPTGDRRPSVMGNPQRVMRHRKFFY